MPDGFQCPLCGGTEHKLHARLRDRVMRTSDTEFDLVTCSSCGLMRLHPQPDAETLAASYPSTYAPHVRPGLSGRGKGVLERRSVRNLRAYLGPPRRVLDVGCATGDLLLAVRAAGNLNVTGIEPGAEASRIARQRRLNVLTADLASARFEAESFDTVLVSHTLEHVEDPVAFLGEAHRILAPGGAILLWLPNVDSVEAALLRRFWIGYDVPRHLTTFSTGTLGRALRAAGFEIADVRHESIGLEWAWGLRLLVREYVPAADRLLARLHPALIVAFTPLSFVSSRMRRSGRIRVTARKREE